MRHAAILVVTVATLAVAGSRPAQARGCQTKTCELIVAPFAIALGAGVIGVYVGGTGYFVVNDLKEEPKQLGYYGTELVVHGSLSAAFLHPAIGAARTGDIAGAAALGTFSAVHLTLATNGVRGLWRERDDIGTPSSTATQWAIGTVYGINTLAWASGWPGRHGRGYGAAEVAVNAPIVIGLGLLAADRFHDDRGRGAALLYSGMASISALYVAHGVKTFVAPKRQKLDLLGTDLIPTVVSDGRTMVPGLGTAGSF